jgi:putative N-acetylmannosamine-6-phosphate epimerase
MFGFFKKKYASELEALRDVVDAIQTHNELFDELIARIKILEKQADQQKIEITYLNQSVKRLSGYDYHGLKVDGTPRKRPGRPQK